MDIREIPHNIEAELAVLSAMMINTEAAIKAAELLSTEDFYRESHKLTFTVMKELVNKQEAITIISLSNALELRHQLELVGGYNFLMALNQTVPTTANLEQNAAIVKDFSLRRKLLRLAHEIMAGVNGDMEAGAQLEEAQEQLSKIQSQQHSSSFQRMESMVTEYVEQVCSIDPEKGAVMGIPTCFEQLDLMMGGLQPSDFIILAARPSMGKTAMVLNMIENIILNDEDKQYSVAMFSLEMDHKHLVNRILANITGIDSRRLDCNNLSKQEWDRVWAATELLSSCKLFIDDTAALTVPGLRSRCRQLKLEQGLDLVVIDYLQLMNGTGSRTTDRQQIIADISRGLKALARELQVPVIALSQLSRGVESRQLKRPTLSDCRDSGSIEQDADIVTFLYRDEYYYKDTQEPGITELIIAKHRNGPTGVIKFIFEKQYTRFIQLV